MLVILKTVQCRTMDMSYHSCLVCCLLYCHCFYFHFVVVGGMEKQFGRLKFMLVCDLFRPVDMLTSASLKILCETLPVTTTLLKWIFIRHHFPLLFISLAYTIYNLVYSNRTWEIEMIYVLIIKTKNIITVIIAKNTVKNDYHLILKVFSIIIWIFLTYQGLHLQCCDNYQSEQPPDWQVQNSIVDASKNQICRYV